MTVSFVQKGGLLTVLSTDRSFYYLGEPVRMSLFKLNVSPYPITFTYTTSQRYEFAITGYAGQVWQWSADRIFLPVVEQVTLNPGQSLIYIENWLQVDFLGSGVGPGFYRITGWNTTDNSGAYSKLSVLISVTG